MPLCHNQTMDHTLYVFCFVLLLGRSDFINYVSERGLVDGCVIFGGMEGGTEVEGGVCEGRCSKIDGGFGMRYVGIGFLTIGGESIGSLGLTELRRSTIS